MSDVTAQNCDACFAASFPIATYRRLSFNTSLDSFSTGPEFHSLIDDTIEWLGLLRGASYYSKSYCKRLSSELLKLRLYGEREATVFSPLASPDDIDKIVALSMPGSIAALSPKHAGFHVFERSLEYLTEAYGLLCSSPDQKLDILLEVIL